MVKALLSALTALWGALLLGPLWCDPALADKRVALVVGNSAYANAVRLPNPVKDAAAIAEMFQKAGFYIVDLRLDLGSLELKRAMREFNLQAGDADIAVIYFAGHGIEIGGINYLIPVDAKLATDLDAEDEGVSLDRVIRATEPARRLRLVILDACRDNPFDKKMLRTTATRAVSSGLAKIEVTLANTMVAYAAKANSTAEDGKGDHSPFSAALLKYLPEPGVDVRIAFGKVRDEVLSSTGRRQEPFVYGSLGGEEVSLVPAVARIEPQVPASVEIEVRRAYELTVQVGTREAWEAFLRDFKSGTYADLAREQLVKLSALEQERTQAAARKAAAEQQGRRERAEQERLAPKAPQAPPAPAVAPATAAIPPGGPVRPDAPPPAPAAAAPVPGDAEGERTAARAKEPTTTPRETPDPPRPSRPQITDVTAQRKLAVAACRDLLFRAQIEDLSAADRSALQHCR